MKKGFDRLRGVAAASAMSLSMFGAGSVIARTVTTKSTATPAASLDITITNTTIPSTFGWSDIGLQTSVMHDQSMSTTGGFSLTASMSAFGISDGYTTSGSDFFDDGLTLAVGNNLFNNPDSTVDLTKKVVTSDVVTDIVAGIDAQIQYYFSPMRPIVRGVFSLTNTTDADIDTTALVIGNYGSDSSTAVKLTSDGDQTIQQSDLWVITDDSGNKTLPSNGSDPTATITSHGSGAPVVPKPVIRLGSLNSGRTSDVDNYGYRFDVTVPAGETIRILMFNEMNNNTTKAKQDAADTETLAAAAAAGLLAEMSAEELGDVVNYGPDGSLQDSDGDGVVDNDDFFPDNPALSVAPADDDEFLGSNSLPLMATLLGLLSVFRLGRKKD